LRRWILVAVAGKTAGKTVDDFLKKDLDSDRGRFPSGMLEGVS
jgi:hypothetical protein